MQILMSIRPILSLKTAFNLIAAAISGGRSESLKKGCGPETQVQVFFSENTDTFLKYFFCTVL